MHYSFCSSWGYRIKLNVVIYHTFSVLLMYTLMLVPYLLLKCNLSLITCNVVSYIETAVHGNSVLKIVYLKCANFMSNEYAIPAKFM